MLKPHLILKIIILIVLIFSFSNLNSQSRPSTAYYRIENNEVYSEQVKIDSIQKLLEDHVESKMYRQYGLDLTAFSYWLFKNQRYDLGIPYTKKAIEFYADPKSNNSKLHLHNLNLLASYYSMTEEYELANNVLFKVLKIRKSTNDLGKIYRNIAENYHVQGNYHTATNYFLKASEAYRKEKRYRKLFDNTLWLSKNYRSILDDTSIKKGIACIKDLDTLKPYIKFEQFDEYLINERLGNLYNYESLFDSCESLPYYKKALSIVKQLNLTRNISLIHQNIGYLYREKDNDSAFIYFKKALQYSHEDLILTAQNLYALGLTHLDQEEYDLAYNYMNLSLEKLKTNKKTKSLDDQGPALRDQELGIQVLQNIAITRIKKFKITQEKELLADAFLYLKRADQLIDLIKLESNHRESKLFWRELASDIYINLVKVCYLKNDPTSAYHYLEKNKALLLLEDLTQEKAKNFFDIPENIIKKELFLKRKIASVQNKTLTSTYNDKSRSLELFEVKNQYKSFIDSLQYEFPKYYQSKEKATILPFKEVLKKASKTNTTYIHYILDDASGYALIISENKQKLFEIHNLPLIQKYISRFQALTSKPFSSKSDKKEFQKINSELSKSLFPDNLLEKTEGKIIIIPDNSLLSIPFETLTHKNEKYLIEDFDISYAYSISFLEQNKELKRKYQKEFLGFAPIDYQVLSALPDSDEEIHNISEKFNSDVLLQQEATRENLIHSLSDYKIVHLSTHANANDSITPWIATNTKNITLNDIYSTKNNAELVTLSACNTSIGKLYKGEGVMSLARGFFNTGANSVISTLWKADDQSTKEIITDFYSHLKRGLSKSEALRQAKLEYLKNHSFSEVSPYYWSSLILIGNPDAMYSSLNTAYLLIGISISFLLIFLFYKRISKKVSFFG